MALSYDHLFSDIGEMVEAIDDIHAIAKTTLPAMADEIHDELIDETDKGDGLTPTARYDILSGIPEIFEGFQDTAVGWIAELASKIEESLTDVDMVLQETDLPLDGSVGAEDVLIELYRKMIDDAESVNACILQICGADANKGTATADGNNVGTGKVFVTRILDGYTEPISGGPSIREYAYDIGNALWPGGGAGYVGTESQLGVTAETMTLTCTADSETDGAAEGGETFGLVGNVAGDSPYDWESEGSGTGPSVTVMNQSGLLTDGEFENFTANDPDSWTIDSGQAGTNIFGETTAMHRGSAALKFTGDTRVATVIVSNPAEISCVGHGLVAGDLIYLAGYDTTPAINGSQTVHTVIDADTFTINVNVTVVVDGTGTWQYDLLQVSQDASASLVPLKRYCVACWVKGEAGIAAGALAIEFVGTGYTAPTVEKISMNAAALAAQVAYGEEYFFVTMPPEIPDDFELVVKITGALTDTKNVTIDGLAIGELAWHGGVGFAILAGNTAFLRGDRFTAAVANDNAGTFQTFFRRQHGLQLPGNDADGETISDTWAE